MSHSTAAADTNAAKKPQPLPRTHQETPNLIQAYQEKWYSLKADQWEEVALTVASRCSLFDHPASKTTVRCRYKMEKLRRCTAPNARDSLRAPLGLTTTPWKRWSTGLCLSRLDHCLLLFQPERERDIYPDHRHEAGNNYCNDEEEEEGDDDEEENYQFNKSRSINYILRRPSVVNRFLGRLSGGKKRVRPEEGGW
ncbi:Sec14p-like phosphatidylinositol transfer family protein [Hibiscus syriacus]|uniref:Sec14p-like phosphatidylinositol transfer family protein n=1 Tax=Hibiscus syriacus TaxID=106335 RepID=A0A6A2Z098_HIBSY|nr:Sec14p-like phosphatidylinositol transfer family protein [Hibiscus syriacus]